MWSGGHMFMNLHPLQCSSKLCESAPLQEFRLFHVYESASFAVFQEVV